MLRANAAARLKTGYSAMILISWHIYLTHKLQGSERHVHNYGTPSQKVSRGRGYVQVTVDALVSQLGSSIAY